MRLWALAFLLGMVSVNQCACLPTLSFCLSINLLVLLCLGIAFLFVPQRIFFIRTLLLLQAMLLGATWIFFHAQYQLTHTISAELEGKTMTVIGRIITLPEVSDENTHFEMQLDQLRYQNQIWKTPQHIRLSWYGIHPPLWVGQRWQYEVRLRAPRSTLNPASFDYERWLFAHRIQAVGYVIPKKTALLLNPGSIYSAIDRLRQSLNNAVQHQLAQRPFAGLITALIIGSQFHITPEQWQVMQGTGTNHLMAIAGLHIGFVAGFFAFLTSFIWRRIPACALRIPTPHAAAFSALLSALIYSALAGFALPTQRAVLMLAIFLIAVLYRKQLPPWQAWCFALLAILVFNPLATLSDSFWLSFTAVAMIIYGVGGRTSHTQAHWKTWGRIQWVVSLGLLPITLLFFHQVSFTGLLANAIAIPWVGFIVIPFSLLGGFFVLILPSVGGFLLLCAERALAIVWHLLQFLASLKYLQWQVYIPNDGILFSAMIGALLLLAPRGIPGRWLCIIWFLPLYAFASPSPKPHTVWISLLDVGQGLSSVVRTQHHVLVYDTGAKLSDQFDMGKSVLIPFLHQARLKKIDTLIISHGDNDHIGGAFSLLHEFPIHQVLTSVPERFPHENTVFCAGGQRWEWDGVIFEMLYPPPNQRGLNNDNSCVLRIQVGQQSILLPGDIEKRSERWLVEKIPHALHATLIIAPHHGSRTSSTEDFVAAVHPQIALFATGYRNRYHFPNPAVMSRYQKINARFYSTAEQGAISFNIAPDSLRLMPSLYRQTQGHYWNAKGSVS